ncbi:MAG TPA: family 43 glycosylhydrolase [Thermoguttaceae bacterium]|nr:family 43 glycosylhydrolase [Thermoguttaceae bacterium]
MTHIALLTALLLATASVVSAGDVASERKAVTVVTLTNIKCPKCGDVCAEKASLATPQITAVDGVREGKWCGAMWCPVPGTSVKLIGNTGPAYGIADVYIDGIFRKSVDWYSEKEARDVELFSANGLADGRHLLGVLARATKRPESTGTAIHWSRVEYMPGQHPDRFTSAQRTRFDPNAPLWLDDRGESVQCHMGNILFHDGKYYMAGGVWPTTGRHLEGLQADWCRNAGIAVYSSPDLMNWKYRSTSCTPVNEPGHPLSIDINGAGRPKLLRARGTGKFVLFFHLVCPWFIVPGETLRPNFQGVAVADQPEGPYKWHGLLEYDGKPVQGSDNAVFTDDDGSQYLIAGKRPGQDPRHPTSAWNVADCLYKLSPDCLHVEKAEVLGTGGEAAAIFKHDGVYYLLHSELSGLIPNENFYHTAKNIWGPWEPKGKIAQGPHSEQTFQTQTTAVVPVAGKPGAFIWIGDSLRNANTMPHTRTVWLPVTLKGNGEMEVRWRDNWDLSVFDGASGMKKE